MIDVEANVVYRQERMIEVQTSIVYRQERIDARPRPARRSAAAGFWATRPTGSQSVSNSAAVE